MQLDGLLGDVTAGPADLQLGARRDDRIVVAVGNREPGVEVHAAGQLQRYVHAGRTLRQRLEVVQGDAKLPALLEVIGRQAEGFFHRANRLGRQRVLDPNDAVTDGGRRVHLVAEWFAGGVVQADLRAALTFERRG